MDGRFTVLTGPEPAETSPSAADSLSIRLFGCLELERSGQPLPPFPTRKSRSVFSFLLMHSFRMHHRDVVTGMFWGDHPEPVAKRYLRTELWRIRQVLGSNSDVINLRVEDHMVGIGVHAGSHLDTADFEQKLSRSGHRSGEALTPEQARTLEEAAALYRGDLLEEVYDDWCVHERERLRALALDGLFCVMCHHLHEQNWAAVLKHGQRLLEIDPLQEHVHVALMRCHLGTGNRAGALRQYSHCVRLLREELDIEPMPETVALYDQIRAGAASLRLGNGSGGESDLPLPSATADILQRLRAAERDLLRARRYLRRGLSALRSLTSQAPSKR